MKISINSQRTYTYDEKDPKYSGNSTKVFIAYDEYFDRKVILKEIDFSSVGHDALTHIRSEVVALSKAGGFCPNVPVVLDYWTDEEKKRFYIVMQLIPGDSLRSKLMTASRTDFHRWMMNLSDTLISLHKSHIVHKDIKPENIIITNTKQLYLIDFNISINESNLIEGTEFYKAPEMGHEGITISREQSDIFSVGVMMYEFYTGNLPKEGVDYGTKRFTLDRNNWSYFKEPIELNPNIPPKLNDIIKTCMERSPQKRYQRASDLKNALKSVTGEISKWRNQ